MAGSWITAFSISLFCSQIVAMVFRNIQRKPSYETVCCSERVERVRRGRGGNIFWVSTLPSWRIFQCHLTLLHKYLLRLFSLKCKRLKVEPQTMSDHFATCSNGGLSCGKYSKENSSAGKKRKEWWIRVRGGYNISGILALLANLGGSWQILASLGSLGIFGIWTFGSFLYQQTSDNINAASFDFTHPPPLTGFKNSLTTLNASVDVQSRLSILKFQISNVFISCSQARVCLSVCRQYMSAYLQSRIVDW